MGLLFGIGGLFLLGTEGIGFCEGYLGYYSLIGTGGATTGF